MCPSFALPLPPSAPAADPPVYWPERRYAWGTAEAFNREHSDLLALRCEAMIPVGLTFVLADLWIPKPTAANCVSGLANVGFKHLVRKSHLFKTSQVRIIGENCNEHVTVIPSETARGLERNMDETATCSPSLRQTTLPGRSPHMEDTRGKPKLTHGTTAACRALLLKEALEEVNKSKRARSDKLSSSCLCLSVSLRQSEICFCLKNLCLSVWRRWRGEGLGSWVSLLRVCL